MKLHYTLPALADLDAILEHIDRHSPQGALRVKARIQRIIDLLLLHPQVGTPTAAYHLFMICLYRSTIQE